LSGPFCHIGSPFDEDSESGYFLRETVADWSGRAIQRIIEHNDVTFLNLKTKNEHEELLKGFVEKCGDRPVYVTFDMDCLDELPVPEKYTCVGRGILHFEDAEKYLSILSKANIIGLDIAEISDHEKWTKYATSVLKTVLTILEK
jgi:arginase family enzyme